MLTSACPGWICYAEKTHGNFILPYISVTKSPQQIMGSLVKQHFGKKLNKNPDQIYHVTIMPCYDKKLEASRQDFYNDIYETRDVDLVITSMEVESMLLDKGVDLKLLENSTLDSDIGFFNGQKQLLNHRGGGSGGYLEHVFLHAAKVLYNIECSDLKYKVLRNKDFQEVLLEVDGEVKLRFAFAYGFRNIQNVVQKMKRKKCSYDFIEIMACPSGCLNGGGQIRADTKEEAKQLLDNVGKLYKELPNVLPEENELVTGIYSEFDTDTKKSVFATQYHAITKTVNALNIKW